MAAFGEFFSQIVAFASTEPDPLQFVFAASGEVTGLQRAQSEAEMADSGAYLEGIVGEFVGTGQDVELVESGLLGVPPVGEEALGIFIVFQSQGVVLRLDVVHDLIPTWSPDGLKIAFDTVRDGNWEIYVMIPS